MLDDRRILSSALLTRLIIFVSRQHRPLIVLFSYIAVCFIGVIDYLTGVEIALSIFYVVPVVMLTLSTRRRHGIVISIFAGTVWLAADLLAKHTYSHALIPLWNAMVRFSFFAIMTYFAAALKKMYEREEILARTDYLTGTANRRSLFETAQARFLDKDTNELPFTVIYLDLDNFKMINDTLGHATGDNILRSVGETIKQNLRKTDMVARMGGDEFVALLPGAGSEDCRAIAYKIENSVAEQASSHKWPLSVTMGVATFLKPPASISEMINKADNLMYEAKDAGKHTIKFRTWTT